MKARGGSVNPHHGSTRGPITPIQHKVLSCLVQGMSYEEAREHLGYKNVHSIRTHVALSAAKLGVGTSQALTGLYARYVLLRRMETDMRGRVTRLRTTVPGDRAVELTAQHLESIANAYRYEAFELVPALNTPKCVHGRMISMERCQACRINRSKEHTFQSVRVKDPWDGTSSERCTYCCETRRRAAHRAEPKPFATPKDLPDGVKHGSLGAYRKYGCRCQPCCSAQSSYMADWRAKNRARKAALSAVTTDAP